MEMAEQSQKVTGLLKKQIPNIEAALKLMNNSEVAKAMDKFETVCENLQVQSGVIQGTLGDATTTANKSDVDDLLNQLKDQQAAIIGAQVQGMQPSSVPVGKQPAEKKGDLSSLEKELAALK